MSFNIQFADDQLLLEDSSTIIYGDSGIGKTTIAKQWPNPLFLIMRGGGEHRPAPLLNSGIPYIEVQTKEQMDEILIEVRRNGTIKVPPQLKRSSSLADAITKASDGKFTEEYAVKTIVIDQLSSMHTLFINHVLTKVARNRENPDTPNQQDYQQTLRQFNSWVIEVNQVPRTHKVWLALAEIDEDTRTKERYGAPSIPGRLAVDILKYVDFVFRFYIRRTVTAGTVKESRVFQTQPDGMWKAKDSTGKLPAVIEIPGPAFPVWSGVIVPALEKK